MKLKEYIDFLSQFDASADVMVVDDDGSLYELDTRTQELFIGRLQRKVVIMCHATCSYNCVPEHHELVASPMYNDLWKWKQCHE